MFTTRLHKTLKTTLPLLGSILLLIACGVPRGKMRVSGTYESFKDGAQFLIVSTDGGLNQIDTLHVVSGEFDYMCSLNEDATFYIVYADNSNLPLWVHSGDHIKIKEGREGLWKVEVKGNEENELYSQFRLENAPNDTAQLRQSAARFIRQHPTSAVSQYLLSQYFILTQDIPTDSTENLYQAILQSLPEDPKVATLGGLIQQKNTLRVGAPIPNFDITTTDSIQRTYSQYKGKHLIIYFWSGYLQSGTTYMTQTLLKAKKEKGVPVELISYNMDVDKSTFLINRGDENEEIPTHCDLQGFNSPLATLLGIRSLPQIVVVGPDGIIKCVTKDPSKAVESF